MANKPEKKDFLTRWGRLKSDRSSWMSRWETLSELILPMHGEYFASNRDHDAAAFNKMFDSVATWALEVLAAGMQSGVTSPSRKWFRLMIPGSPLNDDHDVQKWLNNIELLMQEIFNKSNTYRALHTLYKEIGCFGTGVSVIVPDFNDVIHHYPLTAGEYALATDARGHVNTLYREFRLTVAEMVGEFGLESCSVTTRNMFEKQLLDELITILHVIEPRRDRDVTKKNNQNMPYGSYYIEYNREDDGKFLREGGFPFFPVLAPRWSVTANNVYGNSPAMTALGDVKQLYTQQKRKQQVIDLQTLPPLQAPSSLRNTMIDALPGGITFYDQANPQSGIRSMFEVQLDSQLLLQSIQEASNRIQRAFHADIFLMFDNLDKNRMTATEVAERQQEKMLMLGPVFERLINELLDPLIEITFACARNAGIVPPPPEAMQNIEMDVDYVSIFAQAQKAVGINAMRQFFADVVSIAQAMPEALDMINTDETVRLTANAIGVDPRMLNNPDVVNKIRQQRAEQQQEQQQMAAAQQQANTMKTLSDVDTSIFDQGMGEL